MNRRTPIFQRHPRSRSPHLELGTFHLELPPVASCAAPVNHGLDAAVASPREGSASSGPSPIAGRSTCRREPIGQLPHACWGGAAARGGLSSETLVAGSPYAVGRRGFTSRPGFWIRRTSPGPAGILAWAGAHIEHMLLLAFMVTAWFGFFVILLRGLV